MRDFRNNSTRQRSVAARAVPVLLSLAFLAWGDGWEKIRSTAGEITSVRANFTQRKQMAILARPLVSRGTFYFQAPTSLRWEYESPVRSVLLMHNRSVRRYVERGGRMMSDSTARLQSMRVVLQEITMWMKGSFDANPDFTPTLRPGRVIVLTPKERSMAEFIQRIELRLSATPGVIRSVMIYESDRSSTLLEFSGVRLNEKLPDSLFRDL
ncbi:MAG: outer membrane lipoprotein carrier protein LolA [Spirochaetes bacterium]|nr:outer membrane lipoprotein carrier protein LolA [Spirochaetota bacterium]